MVLIFILYFLWALLLFVNQEIVFHCTHPFFVGGLRSVLAGILMLAYSYFVEKSRLKMGDLSRKEWSIVLLCGIMLYGIAASGFSLGLDYTTPIVAAFIYSVAPFITAALMYFLYNQKLSVKKTLGLFIGFISVLGVVCTDSSSCVGAGSLVGAIILFFSTFLFCYAWVLFKDIIENRPKSILLLNSLAMVFGGGVALSVAILCKVTDDSMKFLFVEHGLLLMLFIVLTAVSYGLYSYLLGKYSPTLLSFAGFLDPMFGTVLGILFFGHHFYYIYLVSFWGLSVGLYLFYKEELEGS